MSIIRSISTRVTNSWRDWLSAFGVFLYFALMSILFTWPLVLKMDNYLVGEIGDNIYFVWLIGWFQRAIFTLHQSPFIAPFLNYPEGWQLAHTEISPANVLMALPASLFRGPVFAYNFTLLIMFVLSGIGMYLWIRNVTGSRAAGILAGTLFTFSPYHMSKFLIGHFNLMGIQWLPFYFWGLTDLLEQKKSVWKPALLAGVSLGLISLTSLYYFYMTALLSLIYIGVYLLAVNRQRILGASFWRSMVVFTACALPLTLTGVLPFVRLSSSGEMPDRSVGYVRKYSASPMDFFLPSTDHFLFGVWVGDHFNRSFWNEATLYIGAAAGVLALLAVIKRKQAHPALVTLCFWTGVAAFILALGTDLHWNARPITEVFGPFHRMFANVGNSVPLPGLVLFKFLPFYAKMRVWMRFGMFSGMFVAVLAGLGSAWLFNQVRLAWRTPVSAILMVLVLLDFYPGSYKEFAEVKPRPVDIWLAEQPGKGAVAEFPAGEEVDQDNTYFTLIHQKPFIGGFFNAFPPHQYLQIQPALETFPSAECFHTMRSLGVQFVLIDLSQYEDPQSIQETVVQLGGTYLITLENEAVYEIR